MLRSSAILLAATLLASVVTSGAKADDCEVDAWRHYADLAGGISIEGSTTCQCGRVYLRAYDGERFIGADSASVRGYTFRAWIRDVPKPSDLNIKATVESSPCR
jgi:hypothetical protein